jgi:hypothetical protein
MRNVRLFLRLSGNILCHEKQVLLRHLPDESVILDQVIRALAIYLMTLVEIDETRE